MTTQERPKSGVAGERKTTRHYGDRFLAKKFPYAYTSMPPGDEDTGSTPSGSICNPRELFRDVYGPFLSALMVASALTTILGLAIALAGSYLPRNSIEGLMKNNVPFETAVSQANNYNKSLESISVTGVVLLSIGGAILAAAIVSPFLCGWKAQKGEGKGVLAIEQPKTVASIEKEKRAPMSSILFQVQPKNKHKHKGSQQPAVNPDSPPESPYRMRKAHARAKNKKTTRSKSKSGSNKSVCGEHVAIGERVAKQQDQYAHAQKRPQSLDYLSPMLSPRQ